jgi:23S rRNA pseudouridine1911/1915/1917 synthase
MKWTIESADAKKRFDVYLAEKLGCSRAQAQKTIKHGEASVNNHPTGGSYRLKLGETVTTLPASNRELPEEAGLLEVVAETKDYLVINKPAGLTVHATSARQTGTLANLLLAYLPSIRSVGEAHRPGIVHRLDRDVSGCLVAAKNQKAYEYLKGQFAERKVAKEYAALALGPVKEDAATINAPVGRNRKGRMAVKKDGLEAITHYEVIGRGKKTTLLKIKTETGRMHQIRVHLKYISHPIAGDELYAPKDAKVKPNRLMLHATKIGFTDLQGNAVSYECALPPEFNNLP